MKIEKFNKILTDDIETFENVKFSMSILDRLHELLNLKFGGKQKLLAEKMGKSEAEISKLLSGIQNYTTKTIIKFQIAFGEPILAVCGQEGERSWVEVKCTHKIPSISMEISESGLEEKVTEYQDLIK